MRQLVLLGVLALLALASAQTRADRAVS
jgi:hypothetical protein